MNSKPITLGLALLAALALSAVAAASASAVEHKFNAGANPTHLTAEAEPGEAGHHVFEPTTGEHKAEVCTKVEVAGTIANPPVQEVTVEPQFKECGIYQTKEGCENTNTECTEKLANSTFINEGCHTRFYGETTQGNPTGGEHANVEINSTGVCTHIETRVTALKLKCFSVPTQLIKHAVRYKNQLTPDETEDVTVEATAHGVVSTTTNSAACPTGTGETEVHTNGSTTGALSVTGFADEAHTEPTNVTIE